MAEECPCVALQTDHRPWGDSIVLADEADHKVKRVTVLGGKRSSLQRHQKRSEHWFVVSGQAVVTLDAQELHLGPGDAVDIPVHTRHRIANPGSEPMVFIEVQSGEYFGEDDVERIDDDYGRA